MPPIGKSKQQELLPLPGFLVLTGVSSHLEQDPGLALRKTSPRAWGQGARSALAEGAQGPTRAFVLTALILMALEEQQLSISPGEVATQEGQRPKERQLARPGQEAAQTGGLQEAPPWLLELTAC